MFGLFKKGNLDSVGRLDLIVDETLKNGSSTAELEFLNLAANNLGKNFLNRPNFKELPREKLDELVGTILAIKVGFGILSLHFITKKYANKKQILDRTMKIWVSVMQHPDGHFAKVLSQDIRDIIIDKFVEANESFTEVFTRKSLKDELKCTDFYFEDLAKCYIEIHNLPVKGDYYISVIKHFKITLFQFIKQFKRYNHQV